MRTSLPGPQEHVRDQRIDQVVPLLTPALMLHQLPAVRRAGRRRHARARRDRGHPRRRRRPPARRRGPVQRARRRRRAGVRPRCSARRRASSSDDLVRRHARLLREAAHDDRLEGHDQRPAPRRLRRRQRRPAHGARPAARRPGARAARRLRVPGPDHAAVHLRRRVLGGDRRAHDREPDPPPARVRASRCPWASRTAPTATSAWRSTRCAPPRCSTRSPASTSPAPRRSCTPSGNEDCHVILRGGKGDAPTTRADGRRRGAGAAARRRAARAPGDRRLARQQRQGPRAPAGRRRGRSPRQVAGGDRGDRAA